MKTRRLLCLVCMTSLLLFSCASQRDTVRNYEWIPIAYDPTINILLVEAYGTAAQNQAMRAYMTRRYPYRFVLTTRDSIEGTPARYADNKYVYRFGIIYSKHTTPVGQDKAADVPETDLHFYDRVTGKHFPVSGEPSTKMKLGRPALYWLLKSRDVWSRGASAD